MIIIDMNSKLSWSGWCKTILKLNCKFGSALGSILQLNFWFLYNLYGTDIHLMLGVSAIRSLLARVRILLSSITVLRDSIHMGSMSPSSTIQRGLSPVIWAKSRIITENKPKINHYKGLAFLSHWMGFRMIMQGSVNLYCGVPGPSHVYVLYFACFKSSCQCMLKGAGFCWRANFPGMRQYALIFGDFYDLLTLLIAKWCILSSHDYNIPSFHSLVAGLMIPNSSSLVTALGFRSVATGFFFMFWLALNSDFQTMDFPVPALPKTKTEWRTSSNSCSCTICGSNVRKW